LDSYSSKTKNGRELKHILEILIRYDIALEWETNNYNKHFKNKVAIHLIRD
jgi:hypothetical protein